RELRQGGPGCHPLGVGAGKVPRPTSGRHGARHGFRQAGNMVLFAELRIAALERVVELRHRGQILAPSGAVKASSTRFPVLRVAAGSKTTTSARSSAAVRCSTPRGTTTPSPGPSPTTRSP